MKMKYFLIVILLSVCIPGPHLQGTVRLPEKLTENIDIGKKSGGEWLFSSRDTMDHLTGNFMPEEWHKVPRFPHNWRDPGQAPWAEETIAWYRLSIHVPNNFETDGSMILRIGPVNDSDETYFNGVLIGKTGEISQKGPSSHGYDAIRLYYVPSGLIKKGQENILLVRIQSFFPGEGGFRDPDSTVLIGPDTDIRKDFFSGELAIFLVTVLLFVFTILFFYRFITTGKRENLFISLGNLSASVYFLVQSQMKFFISTDYHFYKRLEYGLVLYITVFLMDFIFYHFQKPDRKPAAGFKMETVVTVLNLLPLPFILFMTFSGNILLWDHYFNLISIPLWSAPVLFSFIMIIRGYRKKIDGSLLVLLAMTVCTAAMINDVLSDRGVITWGQVSHITLVLFNIAVLCLEILKPARAGTPGRSVTAATAEKIESVKTYLDENYTEDISREGLASSLGISPDHLSRYFKMHTGMKFSEYINRLRTEKAAEILKETDEKIIDIAHACGFESLRSFNRIFRERLRCTPGEYRKRYRKN